MMVCAWALEQGYDVYQPVPGLTPPADLLYDNGWAMTRVQVKRAHERKRGNSRQLRVNLTNGNDNVYEQGGLDCFAVVDVPTGRIWMVPVFAVLGKKSLGLQSGKHDEWLVKGEPHDEGIGS